MERSGQTGTARSRIEQIPSGRIVLEGELQVPIDATGVVLFAHGSGSSRHSPRNQFGRKLFARRASVRCSLICLPRRKKPWT